MHARSRLRAPQGDDVADLLQREAEAPRLRDEVKDAQDVDVVHTVAGRCAARLRDEAPGLVEAQRLAAHPAAGGHLADPQCAFDHGPRIDLAAWGKVKRPFAAGRWPDNPRCK